MKTAVIYARYSSNNQTEQSIEGQIHVCQEYAQKNEIAIVEHYIDRAMTGTNDNRPEFKRMIANSSNKKWDYVLVYKFDRFSRNQYEQVIHEHTLEKHGIKLLSATEPIPTESIGAFMKGMIISYNDYYSKELAEKVKRGLRETRAKGNFQGGAIIYGYKVENHKVVIDEEKAEVVRFIYEQYSKGTYVKDIIQMLNEQRIFNKNKPFARNTIYNILKNEKYSGIYRFKDEIFDNMYPSIVDKEIYDKVRAKTDANKYGKRSTEVIYLLRHKVKCGYCGSNITAECGTADNGTKKRYYKCIGRKHHNGCKKAMHRKDILENFVIDTIIEQLAKPKIIDTIVNNILRVQNEQANGNVVLSALIKEQKQAQTNLDNIMSAVERGLMNNTTNKRMKELETLIEDLEQKILIERSKTAVKLSSETIREFYEQALQYEPQMLINYLIKEIHLFDDKIEIYFNNPLKTNSGKSQGFLFYTKIKQLAYVVQNKIELQYKDFKVDMYV